MIALSEPAYSRMEKVPMNPHWTGCVSWTCMPCVPLPQQIALAATPVFPRPLGHLEMHLPHLLAHDPDDIVDMLDRHGVRAVAATGLLPGSVLHRDLDQDQLRHGLWLLARIGCPVALLKLDHSITGTYYRAMQETITRLCALVDLAAEHDITLAVQTLGAPGQQRAEYASGTLPGIRTLPQVARLLDEFGTESARVGVCVDSVSWAATGADPEHLSALGHPVRHVRIADIPHRVPAQRWGPTQRLMPGDGALPWAAFTSALEQVRYRGPVAVAVSNPRIRDLPGQEIIARSARSLAQVCSTAPATKLSAYAA